MKTKITAIANNANSLWALSTGVSLAGMAFEMGNVNPSLTRASVCTLVFSVSVNMLSRGFGKAVGEEVKRLEAEKQRALEMNVIDNAVVVA